MTLYQEVPKQSIITELRTTFSAEELDLVRLDLFNLMNTCHTIGQLKTAIAELIVERSSHKDLKYVHQDHP